MMDILIKILGVLDKPYHYLMVGLFLVGWKYFLGSEMDLYFWGGIFIVVALASMVEKIIKMMVNKYKIFQNISKEKQRKEELKNYYIKEYKNLNKVEKEIVDCCLYNHITSFQEPLFSNNYFISAIYSLVNKKFGSNINYGGEFMMNKYCYDVLLKYIGEKDNSND